MFLGGNYGDNQVEDSRIGTRIPKVKVPAKLVPGMIREIATYYKDNREEGESFNNFLDRVGVEELTSVASAIQESAASKKWAAICTWTGNAPLTTCWNGRGRVRRIET